MTFSPTPAGSTGPTPPAAGLPARWWQVDPDEWREQVLAVLLRGLVVLGPLVYVPSVMMALREGMPGVIVLDTVAVLGVVALYFLKSLSFRLRAGALMAIFYALGVGLLVSIGSISQIYLLGFAVMTTLMLGLRAGVVATVLNGVTMLGVGALGLLGRSMLVTDSEHLTAWVVLTFNFLMVNALLVLAVGAIIAALERAVIAASETRDALARERTGLIASNDALAAEVAERRRAQADRERLETQLIQAQKMEAVGRLAGGVAHDFNNMLGVILGYTDIITADPTTPESIRSDLEQVGAAARHSAELTRQLLAFARQQTIVPEVLDLNVTVAAMLKMLRRLIGEDLGLVWSPAGELWPVHMDPSQVDQVLANLVVNARDAIGAAGTITIATACVEIDEEYCSVHADFVPGEYVLLSVADDGSGMDRVTLDRIFDPFFTTKPQGQGTGLGLPMVYGIVRQNDGFIQAYSEPGHGTTFRIYLPRHHGVVDSGKTTTPLRTDATGSETVLVVEDEPALLILVTRALTRLGYVVLAASTPGDALRSAAEYPGRIDLLVTDVIMPEMNGLDLRQRLLAIRPEMKAVFMSGYTSDILAQDGVLDEGIHFLTKPFTTAEIADKVRTALTAP